MISIQPNGWQRLWILVSVIYLIVVAGVTVSVMPTRSQIMSSWASDAVDLIKTREKTGIYSWILRKEIFGDATDEEVVTRIKSGSARTTDKEWDRKVAALEAKYAKKIEDLSGEQLQTVGIAFLAWLVPLALLYLLGYGIGWVYRGFKNK